MFTRNLVKNMVHSVTLMIQIENTKISVWADNIVDCSICRGKRNETNENSGLHNLVSFQASDGVILVRLKMYLVIFESKISTELPRRMVIKRMLSVVLPRGNE